MATLYDTLGVSADATEVEIKRAYRKAAMKSHPDRNAGREEVARATFQQVKDAYTILSDPEQRKVYDAIFAEEMRRWESQRQQEERERAEREAAAQAAADAAYAGMVALAMRFASDGYNRDVLFGVLLGRQCDAQLANRIADSVWALHQSRQSEAVNDAPVAEHTAKREHPEESRGEASEPGRRHASPFEALWQLFGVRS
ncbi:MAG: J domain-containing protein [Paraburkholderia sp.]|uniref:J domain-containing protein n=1 Tax=Paraburkholderia sp. TaxID=1926495 RepID=UPI003C4BF1FC